MALEMNRFTLFRDFDSPVFYYHDEKSPSHSWEFPLAQQGRAMLICCKTPTGFERWPHPRKVETVSNSVTQYVVYRPLPEPTLCQFDRRSLLVYWWIWPTCRLPSDVRLDGLEAIILLGQPTGPWTKVLLPWIGSMCFLSGARPLSCGGLHAWKYCFR